MLSPNPNRSTHADVTTRMLELERRLERALLLNEAMWRLLRDRLGLHDIDLTEAAIDLDLEDGKLDGKRQRPNAVACPSCKRPTPAKHRHCLYCGKAVLLEPFH